jgi:hypothetical protein
MKDYEALICIFGKSIPSYNCSAKEHELYER